MDSPRTLANPAVVAARKELLKSEPRVQVLREWADELVERRGVVVPYFDPAEAGVEARVLFLLEAPGPMTHEGNVRPGSGFISVDNNDLTAENTWRARDEAGLAAGALAWNMVPWYLGPASRKPTAAEVAHGALELRSLLSLLPALEAVVLAGRYAQAGWRRHVAPFVGSAVTTIETWHPSPLSLNQPGHRDDYRRAVERAAAFAK